MAEKSMSDLQHELDCLISAAREILWRVSPSEESDFIYGAEILLRLAAKTCEELSREIFQELKARDSGQEQGVEEHQG